MPTKASQYSISKSTVFYNATEMLRTFISVIYFSEVGILTSMLCALFCNICVHRVLKENDNDIVLVRDFKI